MLALLLAALAHAAPPQRVDLELQDADVHAALRLLADLGDVNLVVDDRVKGTITVRLRQVTWEDAFAAVLAAKGLTAVTVGDTVTVR